MHFKGSRSTAVQAASTIFLDNGDDNDVPFEVQTELFAIKTRLENLYLEERGLTTGAPNHQSSKRSRSMSVSSSDTDIACTPRFSSSEHSNSSSDNSSTGSSSPSRLPSLVFDQSDSEEEEQFPELSAPGLLDGAAIRIADFAKDDDASERRLKRRRYVYTCSFCFLQLPLFNVFVQAFIL
ncbi:hypothetical protein BC629DRAFT_1517304 [Irpex lacteus]|nr:hypothetical protein BC629DRAFT_1517304 [Irpex lacteus]